MADDLPIKITLDPTQAAQGSKKLTDEFAKTEAQTKAAEKAAKDYEKELAKLGKEMAELEKQSKQTGNAIANQRAAAQQAASTVGLSSQSLTAARANTGFNGAANSVVSQFTGGMGGAGAIAGAAAAIDAGLKSYDDYQLKLDNATNSLVRFFGTQEQAAQRLPQFQQLQYNLNASLEETVNAFDAVEGATKSLGLSTEQQIAITRNLSQAMIVDGKAIGDVSGVIEKLEFSLDKGSISSGELSKIMKSFPPLAEQWRSEFGMTNAELLKSADNGNLVKLGLERLVTTFQKTGAASKQYEERIITRTELERQAGSDSLPALYNAYEKHIDAMAAAKAEALDLNIQLKNMTDELTRQHRQLSISTSGFVGLAGSIGKLGLSLNDRVGKFFNDPWGDSFFEKGLKALGFSTKYKELLREAANEAKRAREEAEKLASAIFDKRDKPGSNANQWILEQAARERGIALDSAFDGLRAPRGISSIVGVTGGLGAAPDISQSSPAEMTEATKKWREELGETNDELAKMNDIGKTAFGSLQEAIDQFVETGKFSVKDMVNSILSDLAKLGARNGLNALMGLLGSLGSSTTLAPGVAPIPGGAGWPGFATGGYIPPGGSGSSDSQLVAFRKSPWESVHINTPAQESAMTNRSGGGVRIVNQMQDRRALLQSMSDDPEFAHTVLNVVQQYSGSIASLLPR